ncbi:MAG TPA: molybdate ABC transporter substrate-binding protein [Spirochaetota bacterium]|nr:molybdate ABC transporter substrate-binding protein [Spirochaetota bacterium]
MGKNNFKWFVAAAVAAVLIIPVYLFKPSGQLNTEKLRAAVVAGFMQPFSDMSAEFERETGIRIEVTYSSAGKLYSQVINGAPYEIVLLDEERAGRLFKEGYAENPFVYAKGEVVLWTVRKEFCGNADWRDAVKQKDLKKIGIANPEIAVYGMSAKKALQSSGLWKSVEPRLIQSPDLAQVFQYATTEAVDAGFCNLFQAYSEKGGKGCFYRMPEAPPVIHSACLIKNSAGREAVLKFAAYLVSPEAEKIKNKYGYK